MNAVFIVILESLCPSVILSVCPHNISWTAKPFGTKLVTVVYGPEAECHAEKNGYYFQCQGYSERLC